MSDHGARSGYGGCYRRQLPYFQDIGKEWHQRVYGITGQLGKQYDIAVRNADADLAVRVLDEEFALERARVI